MGNWLTSTASSSLFIHIAQGVNFTYDIEAAAIQVYNEQFDDLLCADRECGVSLSLSVQNGGIVRSLTWVRFIRPEVLPDAFRRARGNLVFVETRMNKASSGSHVIFQISSLDEGMFRCRRLTRLRTGSSAR